MTRHHGGTVLAAGLVLAWASNAEAASQLAAKVDPATAGAKAQSVSFDITGLGRPGAGGQPSDAVSEVATAVPADFASRLDAFETCPADTVTAGSAQPDCPRGSVVGTIGYTMWIKSFGLSIPTDRGFVYKVGRDAVRSWVHINAVGTEDGGVVDGRLTSGPAPFGPTLVWDFRAYADGSQAEGAVVALSRFHSEFVTNEHVTPATAPSPSAPAPKHKRKRLTCMQRAARIKSSRRRHAAVRRCRALHRRRRPAHAAQASATSLFGSTACSAGTWTFEARLTYPNGTRETPQSAVACTP
jgi:hypothetical protein